MTFLVFWFILFCLFTISFFSCILWSVFTCDYAEKWSWFVTLSASFAVFSILGMAVSSI